MSLIRKQEAKLHFGTLCLENSPCFYPKRHLKRYRQLQTHPMAEKSHPESPDEAAACCPWGNGWPLNPPDSYPSCHPAVQQVKLGYNYSADNGLQLYIQVSESGRREMIVAGRGWGEVKKSQDKLLFDTLLKKKKKKKSLTVICAPWRGSNHSAELPFSYWNYHEDIDFIDFSRWIHQGLCDCLISKKKDNCGSRKLLCRLCLLLLIHFN